MISLVYVKNNEFVFQNTPFQESALTGQIIYEVIRVIRHKVLFSEDHLERFRNSLLQAGIENHNLSDTIINQRINGLIEKNDLGNGNIKFLINKDLSNKITFYAFIIPHHYPSVRAYEDGVKIIIFEAERSNPAIKQLHNTLKEKVDEAIRHNNAFEALLLHPNGYITEGSKSNFFLIRGETVYTSPEEDILAGVTRKNLLKLFREKSIKCVESRIMPAQLNSFEAAFISGTSPKVLPIKCIEETLFNPKHMLLSKIISLYNQEIEDYLAKP
jgi:branched-chain amino acid aminotransferase